MTPNEFQSIALSWIGAIAVVVTALFAAYAKFAPMIAELRTAHAVNAQQIIDNTSRLDRQGAAQSALLLAAPAPGTQTAPAAPVTVNAPVADAVTVNTGEGASAAPTVAPTPEPAPENKSISVDRDFLEGQHAAIGKLLGAGDAAGVGGADALPDGGPSASGGGDASVTAETMPDALPSSLPAPDGIAPSSASQE